MTVADLFSQNIENCKKKTRQQNDANTMSKLSPREGNGSPNRSLLSRKQNLVVAIEAAIDRFKKSKAEHLRKIL
jgi:hypothetical protein